MRRVLDISKDVAIELEAKFRLVRESAEPPFKAAGSELERTVRSPADAKFRSRRARGLRPALGEYAKWEAGRLTASRPPRLNAPIRCLDLFEALLTIDRAGIPLSRSLLIVGSGPAGAGAALAAVEHPGVKVTVIDVGGRLERPNQDTVGRMAGVAAEDWSAEDVATISRQPVDSDLPGLPEKRAFGSDFPFRDFGQRGPLHALGVNEAIISGAYGGFSNTWGAQFMPFTDATFGDWPVTAGEMRDHYAEVLRRIPLAAEEDDLAELFPVLTAADPLPKLSPRSSATLASYARHRRRLRASGVLMGRARLAFQGSRCVRCGLCMTGCPHSLIYSAAQTFTTLREDSRITYRDGLLALRVEETSDSATVVAKDLQSGRLERLSADRVMLACGAIGTSRLVLGSLGLFDQPVPVRESPQFQLPFLSARPVADPRSAPDFTLNQFNMVIRHDPTDRDVSQLHFYTYNQAFEDALPKPLRTDRAAPLRKQLLRRVCVALGYLPSWAAPEFAMSVRPPTDEGSLPELVLEAKDPGSPFRNPMMRQVARRVAAAGPLLDLWPILPALRMSAGGKSYHWGGIFPHTESGSQLSSDPLGRVAPWQRIHLVDSAVLPTIPATTFALTVMANAHRIVDSTVKELD